MVPVHRAATTVSTIFQVSPGHRYATLLAVQLFYVTLYFTLLNDRQATAVMLFMDAWHNHIGYTTCNQQA